MSCGLAAVAGLAHAAPVPRVVRVEAGGDQVASAVRPVVGVDGGLAAWAGVAVGFLGTPATRIPGKDGRAKSSLVTVAVATLPRGATLLLGLGSVGGASAGGGELGATVN